MRNFLYALIAAVAALSAPVAWAADDDLTGVEMDVLDATGTPNPASTKILALPEEASDTAREHAQKGLDRANSARQDGAALGQATAEAAREAHGKPETPTPPETP
jgi:hypothetical protein